MGHTLMTPQKRTTAFALEQSALQDVLAQQMTKLMSSELMTPELAQRLADAKQPSHERLKSQLQELLDYYPPEQCLGVFVAAKPQVDDDMPSHQVMASSIAVLLQVKAAHWFKQESDNQWRLTCMASSSKQCPVQAKNWVEQCPDDVPLRWFESYQYGMAYTLETAHEPSAWQPLVMMLESCPRFAVFVPVMHKGQKQGLLVIECDTPIEQESLSLAKSIAQLMGLSLSWESLCRETQVLMADEQVTMKQLMSQRASLGEALGEVHNSQQAFVESLSYAIDMRSPYTKGQSQGVAHMAKSFAQYLKLNEKTVDMIYYAALLGNLGRHHLSPDFYNQRGRLSKQEREQWMAHPAQAAAWLMKLNFLSEVVPLVAYQNACWDGSGEPKGLSGRDIPYGCRIIALLQAFWALTHPRSYRDEVFLPKEALAIIKAETESKWDLELYNPLMQWVKLHSEELLERKPW